MKVEILQLSLVVVAVLHFQHQNLHFQSSIWVKFTRKDIMSENVLFLSTLNKDYSKLLKAGTFKLFQFSQFHLRPLGNIGSGTFPYILCGRKKCHHFQFYKTKLMLCGPPGGVWCLVFIFTSMNTQQQNINNVVNNGVAGPKSLKKPLLGCMTCFCHPCHEIQPPLHLVMASKTTIHGDALRHQSLRIGLVISKGGQVVKGSGWGQKEPKLRNGP